MDNKLYTMSISLNVLNHLGINLYSNVPAVISEVIANSWDAGASRVDIDFDFNQQVITISDDGCGMSQEDINNRYLYVGYQRRKSNQETPKNRQPMGRKGLGKLSLFSIADEIDIYTKKDEKANAFQMSAEAIKAKLDNENLDIIEPYNPKPISFDARILTHETGTAIRITNLKKEITKASVNGLKKRIARRFSIFSEEFQVFLNGEEISYLDRDYFHKARFLFQYGEEDFSENCNKLDKDKNGDNMAFPCDYQFDDEGNPNKSGPHQIKGWIGIAHHSDDLDDQGGEDDNLNNIAVLVRGKVAQEDILHEFRMGALITKYMYGEIQADFLDEDKKEDIATSGRQKIVEDAPRYQALKKFLDKQLLKIRTETDFLKKKKGVERAIKYNPKIKEWYDGLIPHLKEKAKELLGNIEQIDIEEKHRITLYKNAILAFEKMKMKNALDELRNIGPEQLEGLLSVYKDADIIEAEHYYEIVANRLFVIEKLEIMIDKEDELERVLQEYIFEHLWLLDPAWERATSESVLEHSIYNTIEDETGKESEEVLAGRVDIQYKNISGVHVIIELKRASRAVTAHDLQGQIKKYIRLTRKNLARIGKKDIQVEGICIIGKWPKEWDNVQDRKEDIASLKALGIRVVTYDELIHNALAAYSEFIEKQKEVGKLRKLLQDLEEEANQNESK